MKGFMVGLLVGACLVPLAAQSVTRMVASYNGAEAAVLADSTGRLRVVCE